MDDEQYITEDMLNELGVDLAGEDKVVLLDHLNDSLEERIGAEITESLDDERLKELLDIQESGNDEALSKWLEEHVPELENIIRDNIAIVLGELAENADDVNATS